MSRVVAFHSFRGGTGKSNTTANVAVLAAARGLRVGVIDTDIQSPGIHILLGVDQSTLTRSLNDYLWGRCAIADTAHDVTAGLDPGLAGRVFLIPS
jgi:MinD-like ATPase involved in chromosome partitioning or flagellar assembly